MVLIVELEKYIAQIGVFYNIIREFGSRQKSCPVVLLIVDINSELRLHDGVFYFSPTVCLLVKGNGECFLNV